MVKKQPALVEKPVASFRCVSACTEVLQAIHQPHDYDKQRRWCVPNAHQDMERLLQTLKRFSCCVADRNLAVVNL